MTSTSRPASGYAAWRLIAEELRADIADGRLGVGDRMPTEHDLSERFGVHRHTARQAVASLVADGVVESRRGSGSYVTGDQVHVHHIGVRTRLRTSLARTGGAASGQVLEHALGPIPPEIAGKLALPTGSDGLRAETLSIVDGRPLTRGTHWFGGAHLPEIAAALSGTGSVTAALRAAGIHDYVRLSTVVTARHATLAEAADLGLQPGAVVMVTDAVDALPDHTPIHVVVTRFAASRVALDIEHPGA